MLPISFFMGRIVKGHQNARGDGARAGVPRVVSI
jgi:hypothetical protein